MEPRSTLRLPVAARLPRQHQVDAIRWFGYSRRLGIEPSRSLAHARPRVFCFTRRTLDRRLSYATAKLGRTKSVWPRSKLAVRDGSRVACCESDCRARDVSSVAATRHAVSIAAVPATRPLHPPQPRVLLH